MNIEHSNVLQVAFPCHGKPEIVNPDQGIQRAGVCSRRQIPGMPIQNGRTRSMEGYCVRRAAGEIGEV